MVKKERRGKGLLIKLWNRLLVFLFVFFEELPVKLGFYRTITYEQAPSVFERHARKKGVYFDIDMSDRLGCYKHYIKKDSPSVCVASEDDAEEFCAVANTSYRARKSYGRDRIFVEDFDQSVDKKDVPLFFINEDGEKVGTGMYWLKDNGCAEFGCLSILPKFQRQGWMKKCFFQLMESWCQPEARMGSCWGCYFVATPLLGKAFVEILGKKWQCEKIPNITVCNRQNEKETFFIYCLHPFPAKKPIEDSKKIEPDMSRTIDTVLSFFGFPESSQVAIVAYFLGTVFLSGLWLFWTCEKMFSFGLVLISVSLWNFTEYIFYDYFHPDKSSVNSFALDSKNYLLGMFIYYTEFFVELYFFPDMFTSRFSRILVYFGFSVSLFMLSFQIVSKITLGKSFTYYVAAADEKRTNREDFVDYGIFRYLRHPRYFGFFYWTISLSFVAVNPLCILFQGFMMIKFYGKRIKEEEAVLLKVYGKKYEKYVRKVGVYMPFTAPKYEVSRKGENHHNNDNDGDENNDNDDDDDYEVKKDN